MSLPLQGIKVIDAAISAWTAERSLDDVRAALNEARTPAGKIYDAADIASILTAWPGTCSCKAPLMTARL